MKATMTSKELTTKEAIGKVYCFNKNYNGKKSVPLAIHVTTPTSIDFIHLLVQKVHFTLQQHGKTMKTYETHFFLVKEDERVTCQASVYQGSNSINQL